MQTVIGDRLRSGQTHQPVFVEDKLEKGQGFFRPEGKVRGAYAVKANDVAEALESYMEKTKLTKHGLAYIAGVDRSQIVRLCYRREKEGWFGLDLVDRVFTALGLPLPDLYVRAYIREDCLPEQFFS